MMKNTSKHKKIAKNEGNLNKTDLSIDKNGLLRFKNRLYVPNSTELKMIILE
jgi:hypothetical protein